MKIGVIDYGASNLLSVIAALEYIGHEAIVENSTRALSAFDAIILPGVGDFSYASRFLCDSGLDHAIVQFSESGKTVLGICLGMQLLGESSTENGINPGLGLVSGRTVHLSEFRNNSMSPRVPRMGWHDVRGLSQITGGQVPENSKMYFAHSFAMKEVEASEQLLVSSFEGTDLCVGISSGSVLGLQFHPEKSGILGINVLRSVLREPHAQ
jgi:imidazole glycerol-phosphate synthase subunit HisH